MDTYTLKIEGVGKLQQSIDKLNRVAPDYLFNAIQLAGTKMRKEVIERTFSRVKMKTGNLRGGFVRRAYTEGFGSNRRYYCDVSGGNNKACHYHLIEHGHNRIAQSFYSPKYQRTVKIEAGYTDGFHTMEETINHWNGGVQVAEEVEKAVKKAVKEGLM